MKREEQRDIRTKAKADAATVASQEDESKQRDKMIEIFSDYQMAVAAITESEEKATAANAELAEQIENLRSQKVELESVIATLKTEVDELKVAFQAEKDELVKSAEIATKEATDLKTKLDEMQKEAVVAKRVKDLEEAGLLLKGKPAEKQIARIKRMETDEFKDYVSELVILKEEWAVNASVSNTSVDDTPAEAETDDPEFDSANLSVAQIIKLKRASAALSAASRHTTDTLDENGVSTKLKTEIESLWG
jgi:hypothetical protein